MIIQERHNHCENCIIVKVSRRMQKDKIYLGNEGYGLVVSSTGLRQIFGSNVCYDFGVILRGKGPHKPEFANDIVSLMVYTDLIEYKIDGCTKDLLLHCFFFNSKLKAGNIITTGQYMSWQSFSDLQFRPLLKRSFRSLLVDSRDTHWISNQSEQLRWFATDVLRWEPGICRE